MSQFTFAMHIACHTRPRIDTHGCSCIKSVKLVCSILKTTCRAICLQGALGAQHIPTSCGRRWPALVRTLTVRSTLLGALHVSSRVEAGHTDIRLARLKPKCTLYFHRIAMSTRRKAGQRSGQPPAKRRKREIGQANSDDDIPTAQAQANAPSAAALSQRILPLDHIPSLGAICLKVFAENFQRFSTKEAMWENVRLWLKELPDALVQKIFTTLRHTCPTILNHGLIVSV